jgi:hypothetical protein
MILKIDFFYILVKHLSEKKKYDILQYYSFVSKSLKKYFISKHPLPVDNIVTTAKIAMPPIFSSTLTM